MKQIIILAVAVYAALFFSGFSWGGQTALNNNCKFLSPCSMAQDNRINYIPRPAYDTHGGLMCVMLPFERYWTSGDNTGILNLAMYSTAYSGRCNGLFRWYLKVGIF
jgi:hypothetical protein